MSAVPAKQLEGAFESLGLDDECPPVPGFAAGQSNVTMRHSIHTTLKDIFDKRGYEALERLEITLLEVLVSLRPDMDNHDKITREIALAKEARLSDDFVQAMHHYGSAVEDLAAIGDDGSSILWGALKELTRRKKADNGMLYVADDKPAGLSIEAFAKFVADHPKISPNLPTCALQHKLVSSAKTGWVCHSHSCEAKVGLHWRCHTCQQDYCDGCISQKVVYTSYQVKDAIIIPKTKPAHCSYADTLVGQVDEHGKPYVGQATVFVSHAFGTPFCESLDVMRQYAATHPGAYFWFNPLMTNQNLEHKPAWDVIFRDLIEQIGAVLLVLSPWNDPEPVKRAWCLWEIMCALRYPDKVKFEAFLPVMQVRSLKQSISRKGGAALQALADIQAQNADSYVKEEKEMVFKAIRDSVGFHTVNVKVKNELRARYVHTLSAFAAEHRDQRTRDGANILAQIGAAYLSFGHLDAALEIHMLALKTRRDILGERHTDTARSYNDIGNTYTRKGEYDTGIDYHFNSLNIRQTCHPRYRSPPDIASSYNNLGNAYSRKRQLAQAIDYHTKALEIRRDYFGENHSVTAASYNNLGNDFAHDDRHALGLKYLFFSLHIRIKVLDVNHPDIAQSYNGIANAYRTGNGEIDKAIEYYTKALNIRLTTVGENHQDTANSYNNLALSYIRMAQDKTLESQKEGHYKEALKFYHKSLQIRLDILGEEHPDTSNSYENIGDWFHDKGQFAEAQNNYLKALAIKRATDGETHPDTATTYDKLGTNYNSAGDYGNAIKFCTVALEIRLKYLSESHSETAISYLSLGKAYKNVGELDKARERIQQALGILTATLGADHRITREAREHLF